MSTLHTVNKSPFDRSSFDSCLKHLQPGDSMLLIEDAVVGAMKATTFANVVAEAAKTAKVYALGPDIKARGLDPAAVIEGITVVDYTGFVDLAAENSAVNSWL